MAFVAIMFIRDDQLDVMLDILPLRTGSERNTQVNHTVGVRLGIDLRMQLLRVIFYVYFCIG